MVRMYQLPIILVAGLLVTTMACGPKNAPAPPAQTSSWRIELAGGGTPRVGLPDLVLPNADTALRGTATTIADVLANDLGFEEEFNVIDRKQSAALQVTDKIDAIPYDKWAELGAQYVLVMNGVSDGANLQVRVQIVGVQGQHAKRVVENAGRTYDCRVNNPRGCAHAISDDLHLRLRGVTGVAQSRLVFVSDRDGEGASGVRPRGANEVYATDYDGEQPTRVTDTKVLNVRPTISRDGQWLAYVSYRDNRPDIILESLLIPGTPRHPAGGDGTQNRDPEFSPDGSRIAFVSNRAGNADIFVVDRDRTLPPVQLTTNKGDDITPTFSPNGTEIAFASDRSSPGIPLLYVMGADGLNQRLLYDKRADRPSWSPSGSAIAFTCANGNGYDICVYDFASGDVRKLTGGPGTNEQPFFAPNGRHVLFVTTRWGKRQLAIVNIKGTNVRPVTTVGNNWYPAWSQSR